MQGKDGALKQTLTALATGERAALPAAAPQGGSAGLHPQGISCWMGCDESGKGDVFGPLVAAACLIQADEEAPLRRLGVCDSKMLTDDAIAVWLQRYGDAGRPLRRLRSHAGGI